VSGTRPEVCVGAIALHQERILLIRRARGPGQGAWSIPGGRVEGGETLAAAVVRELLEETGLSGVCERLVGWVERIGARYHYVIFDFLVSIPDGAGPVASSDAAEAAWVRLDQVAELPLAEGLAEFLHDHGILGPAS
jgi:8-oxo-dGTP diphosphatase